MHPPSGASSTDVLTELLPSQNNPGFWERLCTSLPCLAQALSAPLLCWCPCRGSLDVTWREQSGAGLASLAKMPPCQEGNCSLFQPSVGNLTSFALAAPRDLTCTERVSVWHLKMSLRDHNCGLSPGWALKLEKLWVSALLRMGVGTLRRQLLLSHQLRASLDEGGNVLAQHIPGAAPGSLPSGPLHPCQPCSTTLHMFHPLPLSPDSKSVLSAP